MPEPVEQQADPTAAIATRLRELRATAGWTLEELAERTGLSKPFLSRLEAGDRQPSIAAVLTLAKAYAVPVGSLFEAPAEARSCVVVRGGSVPPQQGEGLTYWPLSNRELFSNLQPMRLIVSHRRSGSERYQHDGEEWVYVLSGRLRIAVGATQMELGPGDAAHFDSRQPHRLTALGGKDAEVLLVACPIPVTNHRRRAIAEPARTA